MMNKNLYLKMVCFSVLTALLMTSCKKEKTEEEENDNELITTVQVKLTEEGTSDTETYVWTDIDGAGGAEPLIDNISLKSNTVYTVQVSFLDESKNPVENITEEVGEESDVHRLYFTPPAGITVSNLDNDINDLPIGLNSTWTTTAAGAGTIKITLRHYPNGGKELSDPLSSSKSSTDAEVEFPVFVDLP